MIYVALKNGHILINVIALKKILLHTMTLKFNDLQQGDLSQSFLERETQHNTSQVQMYQCMCASQEMRGPKNIQIKII